MQLQGPAFDFGSRVVFVRLTIAGYEELGGRKRRSTGGRGGGWRLRLVAVAGRWAADRSVGSDLARARGPGSLTGLPRFFRSVAHGGRGCNRGRGPGARGGGGRWPARGAVSPAVARRRPTAIFVRGATARAEPVRRVESRPSRWSSSAAGVRISRGGDATSDSKTLPEYSLTRMRWRVQHAAYTCWV